MNAERVDQIIEYALAVAAHADGVLERELGPIHLVKLVYLADLAHAQRHGGATFTETPWRFYHFGPWHPEVWKRSEAVPPAIGALERRFQSDYEKEGVRWHLDDEERSATRMAELERALPLEVCAAVAQAVRRFGNDTKALLQWVYVTPPMLRAAPGEELRFEAVQSTGEHVHYVAERPAALTPKQEKRRKQALDDLRDRIQAKLHQPRARQLVEPSPQPRYDDEYERGVRWLDSLAGESVPPSSGQLTFVGGGSKLEIANFVVVD
jgi:hypothetical protein